MRNGQVYAPLILLGGVIAMAAMEHALITHDFSLSYVADNNSRVDAAALFDHRAVVGPGRVDPAVGRGPRRATPRPWCGGSGAGPASRWWPGPPWWSTWWPPSSSGSCSGRPIPSGTWSGPCRPTGPAPTSLLQDNPLVALPPAHALPRAWSGSPCPFAFAVASLVTGRLDEDWQGETRRWTLFAWAFLTIGILLGAWWSYQVLGWGGFWAWDPVENAALLPWLVGTAYLHSVMVQQRRGLLRIWNLSLVIATFSLTILGTFLTRSGVIQSVHSFSDSTIGPLLLGFFGLVRGDGVGLIAWRGDRLRSAGRHRLARSAGRGRSWPTTCCSWGSPSWSCWARSSPSSTRPSTAPQVTVGAPYFNRLVIPVGLALLFLMAVAPALPWRKTTLEVMRGRLAVPGRFRGGRRGGLRARRDPRASSRCWPSASAPSPPASAVRALVLSVRGAWRGARRAGAAPARAALAGWRGFVGRANGGMVVHIGVVVIAVGLAAATAFRHRGEVQLSTGAVGHVRRAHHRSSSAPARSPRRPTRPSRPSSGSTAAGTFTPAISQFGSGHPGGGHPGHRFRLAGRRLPDHRHASRHGHGVDLRCGGPAPGHLVVDRGGLLVGFGSVLSAVPGRRRRPTDPVSAPVAGTTGPPIHRSARGPRAGPRRSRSGGRGPTRCRWAPATRMTSAAVAPETDPVGHGHGPDAGPATPPGGWPSASWSSRPASSPCWPPGPRPPRPRCRARWWASGAARRRETVDGTQYTLPRAPGKFTVVNFFASWCEPCQTGGPRSGRVPVRAPARR